jgi:hypothetical protein
LAQQGNEMNTAVEEVTARIIRRSTPAQIKTRRRTRYEAEIGRVHAAQTAGSYDLFNDLGRAFKAPILRHGPKGRVVQSAVFIQKIQAGRDARRTGLFAYDVLSCAHRCSDRLWHLSYRQHKVEKIDAWVRKNAIELLVMPQRPQAKLLACPGQRFLRSAAQSDNLNEPLSLQSQQSGNMGLAGEPATTNHSQTRAWFGRHSVHRGGGMIFVRSRLIRSMPPSGGRTVPSASCRCWRRDIRPHFRVWRLEPPAWQGRRGPRPHP